MTRRGTGEEREEGGGQVRNEGEENRGENMEGTILQTEGDREKNTRDTSRTQWSMENQNIRHNKT